MSGPSAPARDDLLADLAAQFRGPVLEFGGWRHAVASGGQAVTPWRRDARAADGKVLGLASGLPARTWPTAVVHLARGRAGTTADLHAAWSRLEPGGILAVEGANDEGVSSWMRRLREWCAAEPLATVARAHRRAALFPRTAAAGPPPADAQAVPADAAADAPLLGVAPGVFSGNGLDPGTAVMLGQLATEAPALRVLDLGCGAGHLGLWCLRRWPEATALFVDADARAVSSALANAATLGVAARAEGRWADEHDPLAGGFDLALLNPPAHAGNDVDLAAGQALCAIATAALAPGGRLLVVANRRLPYESTLFRLGPCVLVGERDGFKILRAGR